MNRFSLLAALIPLLFIGCQPDVLLPCEQSNQEWSGLLCREYRFRNGSPIGYLDYTYRGDSAIDISTYDTQAILQKTSTERYDAGQLRTVVERFGSDNRLVRSYNYSNSGLLDCIVFGAVDSSECYTYDAQGRVRLMEWYADTLRLRATEYRYFEDEDRLYRINFYDGSDSLLEYRNHEYFLDGRVRIDHFAGDHSFLGHEVEMRTMDGRLLSSRFTAPDQSITHRTECSYDANGRLIERTATRPFGSERTVRMYH